MPRELRNLGFAQRPAGIALVMWTLVLAYGWLPGSDVLDVAAALLIVASPAPLAISVKRLYRPPENGETGLAGRRGGRPASRMTSPDRPLPASSHLVDAHRCPGTQRPLGRHRDAHRLERVVDAARGVPFPDDEVDERGRLPGVGGLEPFQKT